MDLESGVPAAEAARTLLSVEKEAPTTESATLLDDASEESSEDDQTSSRRRPCRLNLAIGLAALGLAAAAAIALAVAGACGAPLPLGFLYTEAVQGKQILATASEPRPGCPVLGPLPELWEPAAEAPPVRLRVLTYNLFSGKLFNQGQLGQPDLHLNTEGDRGTELLAQAAEAEQYDVMGFQECHDERLLLAKAGLEDRYEIFRHKHSCMAYSRSNWTLLGKGMEWVAMDEQSGPRPAQWMRLKHTKTGRALFFVNHHGPIPVNSGGKCGGAAVAHSILSLVKTKATAGDAVVLTGDFNSDASSVTIRKLQERLRQASRGTAHGGVDHIFSNLGKEGLVSSKNWGNGGSDHDALSAVLQVGSRKKAHAAADVVPTVVSYSGFGGFPR